MPIFTDRHSRPREQFYLLPFILMEPKPSGERPAIRRSSRNRKGETDQSIHMEVIYERERYYDDPCNLPIIGDDCREAIVRYKMIFSWYTLGGEFIRSEESKSFHSPRSANCRAFQLQREAHRRGMTFKWSAPVPITSELPPVVYDGPPVKSNVVLCGNHIECACCGRCMTPDEVLCRGCF